MPSLQVRVSDVSGHSPLAMLRSRLPGVVVDESASTSLPRVRATVLLHTSCDSTRLLVLPTNALTSSPVIIAILREGEPVFRDLVPLLRHLVDHAWRESARSLLSTGLRQSPETERLFHLALAEMGSLRSAAQYRTQLADATGLTTLRHCSPSLRITEIFDWVRYLRFVAGLGLGVTQEERAAELGSNLRSLRRVRARLTPWLPNEPRRTEPADVVRALLTRLSPPARDRK